MPGILGIISKSAVEVGNVDRMIQSMSHESFYRSGKQICLQLGVHVGWVCHSRAFSDCMPVWNQAKDICLVFSGEDFRDPKEMEYPKHGSDKFGSENASYLVHLYEEMGLKFIEDLNGWFSGVLIDIRKQCVVLFNDRYGLSRVYYHENSRGIYFASEAKALLKVLPELRQLDSRSVAESFSCGCVLQDRTLFSGISLLPGGSRWIFSQNDGARKEKYFKPETWENQPTLSSTEFYPKLKETFSQILPRYFRGTNPIAMSLTGGLDGRMIMAWANRPSGALPCYSFGSTYRDCADVRIARRVAEQSRQPHETIVVGSQFFSEFPGLAEKAVFVSDGAMDVTGAVELYVNRMARSTAPVRMTGNYGSEILRGTVAFRPGALHESLLDPDFAQLIGDASETYRAERQSHKLSFIAFKQVPWHHYARLSVEQSQLTLRSPYLDNDLVALMYKAPPCLLSSKEPSLRLIKDGDANLAKIPTDRGILYRPTPIIGDIRNLYQEFTVRSEYVYDYGMPKWLAGIDHFLAPLHLEKLFLGRHKFCHFRVWYRDNLAQYVKDILLDPRTRTRPYFRGTFLEEMVNAHTNGNQNYTLEISRALTIELTQRLLVEQN